MIPTTNDSTVENSPIISSVEKKEIARNDYLRWTETKTNLLIVTRNSDSYKTAFEAVKKNGTATAKLWKDLTNECGFEFDSKKGSSKYADLLSVYRREYIETNKTGGVPSKWKYWNLFSVNLNDGLEIDPPIRIKIGNGEA